MADRYQDLLVASKMRKLSNDEMADLQALQNAREAASRDPELIRLKQQLYENQINQWVNDSFRIIVPGRGLPVRNTASEQFVRTWIENLGEQPTLDWWLNLMKDNTLANRLQWTKPLTAAEQKKHDAEQEKRLRERFDLVCRTEGLAPLEANFSIWRNSGTDSVMTRFDGSDQPHILMEDGDAELIPATQEQKDAWQREAQQKRFNDNQDRLKQMRDSNDIAGLRAAAKAEREERYSPQAIATVQQQRVYKELQDQYAKDTQAGFWEPLPAAFTKKQIYTWDANEMRKQMSRYGASRITARIQGLVSIPDGNGGTINFEEKR